MDPVTAFGLASTVLTLVHVGAIIATRLKQLSEAGDVPEVFREIRTRLPLIINIVVNIEHEAENLPPPAHEAFKEVVNLCHQQATQLEQILGRVTFERGDSRFKRTLRAGISMLEESRVQTIAASLRDNVQLLTFLQVAEVGKQKLRAERRPSEALPTYASAAGVFLMPFLRDDHFVGREDVLQSIFESFEQHKRVAISGIGGVGKSQIAIEFCYRYKDRWQTSHVFWVYGGNIARFYQGYKRIAQLLELPGWDDPDTSILELVYSWFFTTRSTFLLVVDNADNIEHWWPGKYKSGGSLDDPSRNLSKFLPDSSENGHVLVTTRDNRVASRISKQAKPIVVSSMSKAEARSLFLSKLDAHMFEVVESDVDQLLDRLDCLPLAVSQAAAFIEENGISIAEYCTALQDDDTENFLYEELDDARRDEENVNSVFRTWKLSYDQIMQQTPRAADLLCLLAMLDRQSVPEILAQGSQSFSVHRLVQRFVQVSLQRDGTIQKWKDTALACVSQVYPTEIGVAQWTICDALAPHVQVVNSYEYKSRGARLDLAHLLCWAADFDIERGMCPLALERAQQSLAIFRELVTADDERLAAATWLVGRLCYYEAKSTADLDAAAKTLESALSVSKYPSLHFAESAFELAHLYFVQGNETASLKMGKASFECWKAMDGPSSVRTLDNMHDYALELAMFGHEEEGVIMWQKILDLCPASNASDDTKTVFNYRSMASIAEFQGDAALAEILYQKLITLCEAIYSPEHIHVFDYRLSHAEQVMRQGRLDEATTLSEAILASCTNTSEWRIRVTCLQTIAECHRLGGHFEDEREYRRESLTLHEKNLGHDHREAMDAKEALAFCFLNNSMYDEAQAIYGSVIQWRNDGLGRTHAETVRAIESLGICRARQGQHADAEAAYLDALSRQSVTDARLLHNLCVSLSQQEKWEEMEIRSREAYVLESIHQSSARECLITALEKQGKMEEALQVRAEALFVQAPSGQWSTTRRLPVSLQMRTGPRFGRIIHPRTWSA